MTKFRLVSGDRFAEIELAGTKLAATPDGRGEGSRLSVAVEGKKLVDIPAWWPPIAGTVQDGWFVAGNHDLVLLRNDLLHQ